MPPSSPTPRAPESSVFGPLLFAGIFIALAALIFTVVVQPPPLPKPSAPGVVPPASRHAETTTPDSMPTLPLTYPATRTTNDADTHFGTRVPDPYRWLEDGKSPEVKGWLADQNHLARTYLDALPGRAALQRRYGQLLHIDTISAPGRAGNRYFYMKRRATDEKAILYWRQVGDADPTEHVLIDPNLYIGKDNAALGDTAVTLDGRLLAYTLRPNAADEATLYVRDVASGRDLPGEVIDGAKYAGPSWLPDGSGFVYTYLPPAEPGKIEDRPGLAVVRFHKLGTDPKHDPVIHDKTGDPTKFISAYVSRDGQWIFFVQQDGWDRNDLYYQPLPWRPDRGDRPWLAAHRGRAAVSLLALAVGGPGLHPDQRGRVPLPALQDPA